MSLREQRDYMDECDWNRPQYGTGKGNDRYLLRQPQQWSLLDVFKEGCGAGCYEHARTAMLMALRDRCENRLRPDQLALYLRCVGAVLTRMGEKMKREVMDGC